jgi:D-alanyl-D-alanine carboxypeptidase
MFKKIRKWLSLLVTFVMFSSMIQPVHAIENTLLNDITATYAIVIDRDTNEVLAQKNADEKMYPASLTKMMTAIIAIENLTDLNQTITITEEMISGLAEADASVAGFQVNDTPTVQDILYGIALPSGADATNAAAFTICGSIDSYVDLMNEKAQQIGMTNTHFVNTTGLHDDNHYSTARDMAKLLQYCLNNETFATIFSSHSYTTSSLTSHPEGIQLESTLFKAAERNNYSIPGLIGGKTGFTYPAGRCLAAWEDVNDMHLITVVANSSVEATNSPNVGDTDNILNQLQSWNTTAILSKENVVTTIQVTHPCADTDTIEVKAPEDLSLDLPTNVQTTITCTLPTTVESTNSKQNLEGDLTVTVNNEVVYTTKIMIQVQAESHLLDKIIIWFTNLF